MGAVNETEVDDHWSSFLNENETPVPQEASKKVGVFNYFANLVIGWIVTAFMLVFGLMSVVAPSKGR